MSTWLPYEEYVAKRGKTIQSKRDLPYYRRTAAPSLGFHPTPSSDNAVDRILAALEAKVNAPRAGSDVRGVHEIKSSGASSSSTPLASIPEGSAVDGAVSNVKPGNALRIVRELGYLRRVADANTKLLDTILEAVTDSTSDGADEEADLPEGSEYSTPPTTPPTTAEFTPPSTPVPPPKTPRRKRTVSHATPCVEPDASLDFN